MSGLRVVVGSAFRDAAGLQVNRWLDQIRDLAETLASTNDIVRAVAIEGDSVDDTAYCLSHGAESRGLNVDVVSRAFGNPRYRSVEDPSRMTALSKIGNEILSSVSTLDDVLLYVESDLIWTPEAVLPLICKAYSSQSVIAPMVFAGAHFYDVWGFRLNGTRFSPFPPYHSDLPRTGLVEIDSAGSCLAIPAHIARSVRMTDGALVEWCSNARAQGHPIFLDRASSVQHPA